MPGFLYGVFMIEIAEQSEEFAELAQEVIQEHRDLHWIIAAGINIGYLESNREKISKGRETLAECIKVKDLYKYYIPHDFLIVIYAPNVSGMSRDQLKILLYHELLHVGMNEKDGVPKYIVNPHDVEDFRTIIDRYGLDWAKH